MAGTDDGGVRRPKDPARDLLLAHDLIGAFVLTLRPGEEIADGVRVRHAFSVAFCTDDAEDLAYLQLHIAELLESAVKKLRRDAAVMVETGDVATAVPTARVEIHHGHPRVDVIRVPVDPNDDDATN